MTRTLRDAKDAIVAAGLTVGLIETGRRHVRMHCRHAASGRGGVIALHYGSKAGSRMLAMVRAEARAIVRGTYEVGP